MEQNLQLLPRIANNTRSVSKLIILILCQNSNTNCAESEFIGTHIVIKTKFTLKLRIWSNVEAIQSILRSIIKTQKWQRSCKNGKQRNKILQLYNQQLQLFIKMINFQPFLLVRSPSLLYAVGTHPCAYLLAACQHFASSVLSLVLSPCGMPSNHGPNKPHKCYL